MPATMKIKNS